MLRTPLLAPLITGPANIQWPTGGLYSPTPAYTSWATGGGTTITRSIALSPDYKLNGCIQVEDTANSLHSFARVQANAIAAVPYVHRVWAKCTIGTRNIQVFSGTADLSTGTATVLVDLRSGAIVTAAAVTGTFTNPAASTAYWGRGWWLISLFFTGSVDAAGLSIIYRMASGAAATYTGDGQSQIAMWGTDWRAV